MASFFNQFGEFSQSLGHAVGQVVQQQHVHQSVANEELNVGKFNVVVVEKLAEGGFGLIELVTDKFSHKELVLKRCNIDRPEVRQIVQKEINILQKFAGPYMVQLLDHSINNKRDCTEALLLMEYYPGGHLLDRLNNRHGNPLPEDAIYRLFGQLLLAVNALHTNRPPIIHRDLKLENVLIGPDGKVRLCDFGSCLEAPIYCRNSFEKESAEASIQKETTQMYRAPEMADIYMRDVLTEKTDIWALGCIFYALCYLKHPFQDKTNLAIMSGSYSIPNASNVSKDSVEFLQRMLDVDPEARPTAAELISQLTELASGRPLPPYTLSEEALRRRQERAAKNIVRTNQPKKYAPTVPQRKGAPPAPTSAAAKRLAAKKGDQVIVSSVSTPSFEADFNAFGLPAASVQRSVSVNGFDPFSAEDHSSGQDDFAHTFTAPPAHTATAFDPFAADDDEPVPTFSTSQPVRQPSFTATQTTTSGVLKTASVASLFPSAEEDSEFSLPDAPPVVNASTTRSSFSTFSPDRTLAPTNSGFEHDFASSLAFDPFAPAQSSNHQSAFSSSHAVRKPSFLEESSSSANNHQDHQAFDPFSQQAHPPSHGLDSFHDTPVAPQDGFGQHQCNGSCSKHCPKAQSQNVTHAPVSTAQPVDILVPTAAPVRPITNPPPTEDLFSGPPSTGSTRRQSAYNDDLLSLSDAPIPFNSSSGAMKNPTATRSANELLSLYDQAPVLQPTSVGGLGGLGGPGKQTPVMLPRAAPMNPFAPRFDTPGEAVRRPSMQPPIFSMQQQNAAMGSTGAQFMNNNNTYGMNTNNHYSLPTSTTANRQGHAMPTARSAPSSSKSANSADPFAALNVLNK